MLDNQGILKGAPESDFGHDGLCFAACVEGLLRLIRLRKTTNPPIPLAPTMIRFYIIYNRRFNIAPCSS
jgi:hypothetical protein